MDPSRRDVYSLESFHQFTRSKIVEPSNFQFARMDDFSVAKKKRGSRRPPKVTRESAAVDFVRVKDTSNSGLVECPHCGRPALRSGCNYVFACGLDSKTFHPGMGCGKPYCYKCGKKFCGQRHDPVTGQLLKGKYLDKHTKDCCRKELGFSEDDYCPGGHNSHCPKRW
jgi:hypothetical protein